jgi:hypothetical protein
MYSYIKIPTKIVIYVLHAALILRNHCFNLIQTIISNLQIKETHKDKSSIYTKRYTNQGSPSHKRDSR